MWWIFNPSFGNDEEEKKSGKNKRSEETEEDQAVKIEERSDGYESDV